jgi:hypothetical protein
MFIDKENFDAWMERIMERFDRLENRIKKEKDRPHIDGEVLLDNQDLCLLLNCSKRTVQYYRSKGWLPFKRIDQKTYYLESDVQKFIRDHLK